MEDEKLDNKSPNVLMLIQKLKEQIEMENAIIKIVKNNQEDASNKLKDMIMEIYKLKLRELDFNLTFENIQHRNKEQIKKREFNKETQKLFGNSFFLIKNLLLEITKDKDLLVDLLTDKSKLCSKENNEHLFETIIQLFFFDFGLLNRQDYYDFIDKFIKVISIIINVENIEGR